MENAKLIPMGLVTNRLKVPMKQINVLQLDPTRRLLRGIIFLSLAAFLRRRRSMTRSIFLLTLRFWSAVAAELAGLAGLTFGWSVPPETTPWRVAPSLLLCLSLLLFET